MICERCGGNNSNDAVKCEYCDQPLNNTQKQQEKTTFFNTSTTNNGRPFININFYGDPNPDSANPFGKGRPKNKWISFILCLCTLCGHKFYEGRLVTGIIYLMTGGLFGIGWFIDLIILLSKPNPYYIKKKKN